MFKDDRIGPGIPELMAELTKNTCELKCSVCGRRDGEGPHGGRRVGPVTQWDEKGICLTCAAWRVLRERDLEKRAAEIVKRETF